ncbi:MAG: hypothetical protein HY321_13620 [Armatimonadetes bacterium]|nr:hypothetical protein [Armatimonadota bacterium]
MCRTMPLWMMATVCLGASTASGFQTSGFKDFTQAFEAGMAASREKRPGEAREAFAEALRLANRPADKAATHLQIGHTYDTRFERREKMAAYEEVLKTPQAAPEHLAEAQLGVALVLHYHAGTYSFADIREAFSKALGMAGATPDDRARALLAVGDLCVKDEEYEAARAEFGKVLEIENVGARERTSALQRTADAYCREGAWPEARRIWEEIGNELEIGMTFYQEGNFSEAREWFRKWVAKHPPESWPARNTRAYLDACDLYLEEAKKGPVDLGSRTEPFMDEWLVARKSNIALQVHPPVQREIVWRVERPWENSVALILSAAYDGEKLRILYRGRANPNAQCLIESTDGIHFTRPELGVFEWEAGDGGKNNIVYRNDPPRLLDKDHVIRQLLEPQHEETRQLLERYNLRSLLWINSMFRDANPEAGPEERYKGFAQMAGLWPVTSPDGVRWSLRSREPTITGGPFDTTNVAFWDRERKVYRAYGRLGQGYKAVRTIQTAESEDFLHWSATRQLTFAPGVPLFEDLYTNAASPLPGAEHIYVMFPMRFLQWRKKVEAHREMGVSDALLFTSRDGYLWSRPSLEGWLRPDLDSRKWTERNYIGCGVVQLDPDEFSLYVTEHYRHDTIHFRRYTVRRHGFASLHASVPGGEFTTRPFTFRGSRLVLNYATSAAGFIRVEVQDADGNPLAGFRLEEMDRLYGNELDRVVSWRGGPDLSALAGKRVRLRFVMEDADLYSLRFSAGG